MEARRSAVSATVLVAEKWVPVLRELFGSHCHDDGSAPDGRARLRLTGSIPLDLARPLAGWGALVEVLARGRRVRRPRRAGAPGRRARRGVRLSAGQRQPRAGATSLISVSSTCAQ